MKNILVLVLIVSLLFLFAIGCSKSDKNEEVKAPEKNNQMGAVFDPSKGVKKTPEPRPIVEAIKNMEKWDSSPDSCRDFCTKWCPKAASCKIKAMSDPTACKRLCYDPCTKGVVPKSFAQCLIDAKECEQIRTCVEDLKKEAPAASKK